MIELESGCHSWFTWWSIFFEWKWAMSLIRTYRKIQLLGRQNRDWLILKLLLNQSQYLSSFSLRVLIHTGPSWSYCPECYKISHKKNMLHYFLFFCSFSLFAYWILIHKINHRLVNVHKILSTSEVDLAGWRFKRNHRKPTIKPLTTNKRPPWFCSLPVCTGSGTTGCGFCRVTVFRTVAAVWDEEESPRGSANPSKDAPGINWWLQIKPSSLTEGAV